MKLPEAVKAAERALARTPSHDLSVIGAQLIANTPELVAMWRTLERRERDDDPWVWEFLRVASNSSTLPPFHYKPTRERREISTMIWDLADRLTKALERNGLDAHLIHSDGKIFKGFYVFEDFSESNQARIDAVGAIKLPVCDLIKSIARRSQQKIADEPISGKGGANARAIRFVRLIVSRNQQTYGEPLNAVAATAANAIFGTAYANSDVRKLLSR